MFYIMSALTIRHLSEAAYFYKDEVNIKITWLVALLSALTSAECS